MCLHWVGQERDTYWCYRATRKCCTLSSRGPLQALRVFFYTYQMEVSNPMCLYIEYSQRLLKLCESMKVTGSSACRVLWSA